MLHYSIISDYVMLVLVEIGLARAAEQPLEEALAHGALVIVLDNSNILH